MTIDISIHPPRVGRDAETVQVVATLSISIHPPRVGRDPGKNKEIRIVQQFQSTLPVWGGTTVWPRTVRCPVFQSTLPVWGGT